MGIQVINLTAALAKPSRYAKRLIPIFNCPACGTECKNERGLRIHIEIQHPENIIIEEKSNGARN